MAVAGSLWLMFSDFRDALRHLRNPGFSIVAVLVLSLGIGANTAVFTDVELLKPLAFADPDRIVSFTSVRPTRGTRVFVVSLRMSRTLMGSELGVLDADRARPQGQVLQY